jgi:hypothetical protein
MRRNGRVLIAASLVALGVACSTTPAPVPLVAEPVEISALAGEWSGEYESPERGRRGTIVFSLQAGTDTAHGDVLMTPRGYRDPLRPAEPRMGVDRERSNPELLTIRFVRIDGGRVSGVLDPYRDPECGCTLETSFTGRLVDDSTIEGTFVTTGPPGFPRSTGTWRVTRAKGPARP